jgi:hypothetical protein
VVVTPSEVLLLDSSRDQRYTPAQWDRVSYITILRLLFP